MPETAPLDHPEEPGFRSVRIRGFSAVAETVSPFTGVSQVYEWTRQEHIVTMGLPVMSRENGRAWIAFVRSLNHSGKTFWLRPPDTQVQVPNAGDPVLDGADQTGSTLTVRGLLRSGYRVLEAGVFVEIDGRLHEITEDVHSESSGEATISVFPGVAKTGLPDGTRVEWRDPRGEFRLVSGEWEPIWRTDGLLEESTLAARSVIRREVDPFGLA